MYTNKKKFHVEEAAVTVLIIGHIAKPPQCQGCRKTYHVHTRETAKLNGQYELRCYCLIVHIVLYILCVNTGLERRRCNGGGNNKNNLLSLKAADAMYRNNIILLLSLLSRA